jgi:biofilm protein TabA
MVHNSYKMSKKRFQARKTTGIFYISLLSLIVFFIITGNIGCSNKNKANLEMKRDSMIIGKLSQAEKYYDMHSAFQKAFTFLRENDLSKLDVGRHEIDGDKMFCLISQGPGKKQNEAKLEAHRKYIDIQYIISGTDEMGWKPTAECTNIETEYSEEKDIEFFSDKPQIWMKVPAGSFAIFLPQDAHAPMVSDSEVRKAVIKVLF